MRQSAGSEQAPSRKPEGEEQKRLFFALELSENWRDAALQAQNGLKSRFGGEHCRWTSPIDMHLTLLFLGEQPVARLPQIVAAGTSAAASLSPFTLKLADLGVFPDHGVPRVLWLGAQEETDRSATRLAAALREPLDPWIHDWKPLRLHITLTYVRQNAPRIDFPSAVGLPKDTQSSETAGNARTSPLVVSRFVLMETVPAESRDTQQESRYTPVHSFLLCGSAA